MPTNLKNGIRPSTETLKKMLSGFADSEAAKNILEAHLKDEIERSGCSLDDVVFETQNVKKQTGTLDEDLKTVQQFMNQRPLRESMHYLAVLIKHFQ